MRQVLAAGYLVNFEWGCEVGEHCGWIILEAEDETQALMAVPSLVRSKARVVQLRKYSLEDLEAKHRKDELD